MELTELERDILHFAFDYTYRYLSDLHVDYKAGKHTKDVERIEEQLHALQTLTIKLLK